MKIDNDPRRNFYLTECAESNWSSRQLERQINSFFYERLLATRKEGTESVKNEIQETEPKTEPDYVLKDPYILEFLDLKENRDYHESELEQALINKLQEFLLELGKGFSFVARQKRITLDGDHFYIDLVFYNYILKCFVIIDLKTNKLTHQDIGQIDFYVATSMIRLSYRRTTRVSALFFVPRKMMPWQNILSFLTITIYLLQNICSTFPQKMN
jgi:predicted nuclease of restriction endonuclease-like (RecB) superfamily